MMIYHCRPFDICSEVLLNTEGDDLFLPLSRIHRAWISLELGEALDSFRVVITVC